MGTLTKGKTFGATEEVTAAKLHQLIDSGTVSHIVADDIDDGVITNAKIVSVAGDKLTGLANIPAGSGVIPAANLTSVAQKGANSDITSLSGLTTLLSRAQGGLASNAANNAASGVVFLDADSKLPAVDGSQLTNLVGRKQLFTSTGTFTSAVGIIKVYVTMVAGGGGGGGGKTGASDAGGGGGGGQAYIKYPITVVASTEYAVTVGAAGTGGAIGANGVAGGNSVFAGVTTLTATAGGYGSTGDTTGPGGDGGGGSINGSTTTPGVPGFTGGNGAAASGAAIDDTPGAGGGSMFGTGGTAGSGVAGGAAGGYGAGGGGGDGNKAGGNGSAGFVLVEW